MTLQIASITSSQRAALATCRLLAAGFEVLGRQRYRGEIYEDDTENEHLAEFLKCHFHRKILRDALLPSTRRQGLRSANQVGKTRIGELIMKHRMKYAPGNMVMYDPAMDKSNDHMKNRFMPMLKAIPSLGAVFRAILDNPETRWNVTTQDILLPGMVFRARPLNESWTQSITVRYGMISDAALCDPAQIRRAFVRSRQHEHDDYWFVESQGDAPDGQVGGGFAEFMSATNEMKLHVRCPVCGTRMKFIFHYLRSATGADGKEWRATAPLSVPSLDREAWVAHHTPVLLGEDRKHAGFRVDGELKLDDGALNEQEVMRNTVYECPHCGGLWRDDGNHGETRRYLDREAGLDENWIAARATALPGYLGYSLPAWINPKISWGSCMLFFRQAMAAKNQGNLMNLQEFQTKWAGEDWDDDKSSRIVLTASLSTIDPQLAIKNELFRGMSVDCQKDPLLSAQHPEVREGLTGHFWVIAHAVDKAGHQKQLWRGYCMSWEEWINKAKELKIPAINIVVDGRYKRGEVINQAAAHAELMDELDGQRRKTGRKFYATWTVLVGSNYRSWRHDDGYFRDFNKSKREVVPVDFNGRKVPIEVNTIEWSNYRFKDTVLDILQNSAMPQKIPGKPTLEVLPLNASDPKNPGKFMLSEKTRQMEVDTQQHQRSWDSQMASNKRGENKQGKVDILETHKDPHYFDCLCGMVYLMKRFGLLGAIAAPEETAPSAQT